ncbi:Fur family transcriptional regulator [Candidatus Frankia meridionalis]|uniref:Ferric uptake regulator, Fur family n=1 Tax=Candidatus Protofrankia datiscae TaxID=2716812 RepID=F8B146_9ACTN|nr:ferric uptake regulator, Fur family [Candidatus Protofrankia datiscae]
MNSEDAAGQLRSAGLRVTAPRLAVLASLAEGAHLSVETIAQGARARLGSLSLQAVYDNLDVLAAAGLVRRFEPAGHPARFELRVGDNHHHLVCRVCTAVYDVDCVIGARPCLSPSDDHGFVIDEAEVTFWGICADCQARAIADVGGGSGARANADADTAGDAGADAGADGSAPAGTRPRRAVPSVRES